MSLRAVSRHETWYDGGRTDWVLQTETTTKGSFLFWFVIFRKKNPKLERILLSALFWIRYDGERTDWAQQAKTDSKGYVHSYILKRDQIRYKW